MARRCLIIGASGQLGRALCVEFRMHHQVIEAANRAPKPGQEHIDLSDPKATVEALSALRPDWILIAGAFCNVDRAETERARCLAVNAEGPRAIAEYAQTRGGQVVYYSTDYVFDGTRDGYTEMDTAHPLNAYADSKTQGEALVRAALPERHLILRTAWLYGPDEHRRNFILRFIDELRAGRAVMVPEDQRGTPTYTEDLAAATRFLLEREYRGTFHAAGPDSIDRVTLARRVCAHFNLDVNLVLPVPTSRLGQTARRPLRVRLDCQKLRATGVKAFRDLDDGLRALHHAQTVLQDVNV